MKVLASEDTLRRALEWARENNRFVAALVADFGVLGYLAEDPALRLASLRGRQARGNAALAVFFTEAGRKLKIAAVYDNGLKTDIVFHRPPRDLRPVNEGAAARRDRRPAAR